MKVALAQIAPKLGALDENLQLHMDYISRAVDEGAELIVFPELSLTGDKIGPVVADVSLTIESEILQTICEASKEIDIVIGLIERSETNLYNRYNSAFYYSESVLVHRHRKLFLVNYAVFDEGKHYVPGNNLHAFITPRGRAAMLICNDVWHAGTSYVAALDGAEIMIVPTNSARETLEDNLDIPATWENMNRAYSAMMGFYTIFVNRVGDRESLYGNYPYWGGSEIIGPAGQVIVKAPYDQEALVFGEVDINYVAEQRYKVPILRDSRLWIFNQEIERLASRRSAEVMLAEDGLDMHSDGIEPIT